MGNDDLPRLQARIIRLEKENASLLAENVHLQGLLKDAGMISQELRCAGRNE